jgi:hypothetical protein
VPASPAARPTGRPRRAGWPSAIRWAAARQVDVPECDIAVASVFTTESATAVLEKMRDQIHAATPAPADFNLGCDDTRTVFDLNKVTGITFNQQTKVSGPLSPSNLNLQLLNLYPGAVGQVAFGRYLLDRHRLRHDAERSQGLRPLTGGVSRSSDPNRPGLPATFAVRAGANQVVIPPDPNSGPNPQETIMNRFISSRRQQTATKRPARARPVLEPLEDRTVLSTLTVLNVLDSGAGSLRDAIKAASSGDTIVFAPSLTGQTITLTSGELEITSSLDIEGPGAAKLAISGNQASRVFHVSQNQ